MDLFIISIICAALLASIFIHLAAQYWVRATYRFILRIPKHVRHFCRLGFKAACTAHRWVGIGMHYIAIPFRFIARLLKRMKPARNTNVVAKYTR